MTNHSPLRSIARPRAAPPVTPLSATEPATGLTSHPHAIGDIAKEFNVTLRTLRFYEDKGLIAPLRRGMTRLYSDADRGRIALILRGKQLGFTLTEIRRMLALEAGEAKAPVSELALTPAQIDEQIALLERQKADIVNAIEELKAARLRLLAE